MGYVWDHRDERETDISFGKLIERVICQLEGAFACVFKSTHFPGELVATRRGSPLLVGIKSESKLSTDHIPILFSAGDHIPRGDQNVAAGLAYLEGMRQRIPSGNEGMLQSSLGRQQS